MGWKGGRLIETKGAQGKHGESKNGVGRISVSVIELRFVFTLLVFPRNFYTYYILYI